MKTSNKLLLGLLISVIIMITVKLFLIKSAIIKEIDNNVKHKIENVEQD